MRNFWVEGGSGGSRIAEDKLKAIVSGDLIEVERKHKDVIRARPTARLIFSANELPRFVDRSNGIWRRLIIVPFSIETPAEEQDSDLAKTLIFEELPGIFNWALEGLLRLLERGRFEEPDECKYLKAEHRLTCAPEEQFIREHIGEGAFLVIGDVYAAYRTQAQLDGNYPVSRRRFSEALNRVFPSATSGKEYLDGKQVRGYRGVNFHPDGIQEEGGK